MRHEFSSVYSLRLRIKKEKYNENPHYPAKYYDNHDTFHSKLYVFLVTEIKNKPKN